MNLVIILRNGEKAKGYVKDQKEFENFMKQVTSGEMVWIATSRSFMRADYVVAVIVVEDKEETT